MIHNYKELYIRINHISSDKKYKVFQKLDVKLDELKKSLAHVNNIIENVNEDIDNIYSEYGNIDSSKEETNLIDSQSDLSVFDIDDNNDLDCSTISFNTVKEINGKMDIYVIKYTNIL